MGAWQLTAHAGLSLLVGLAFLASVAWLVWPFVRLDGIPLAIRLGWVALLLTAVAAPRVALVGFLAVTPLLFILPFWFRWPRASLPEAWLLALLLPAWVSWLRRPSHVLPPAALVLLAVAAASTIVTLAPFQLATGGVAPLVEALRQFGSEELLTLVSQRHVYASALAFLILAEGLALLWVVLWIGRDRGDTVVTLAGAMALAAVLVSGVAVGQWWTGAGLLPFWARVDPNIVRVSATFVDVNAVGAYLASMLPIVVAFWRPGWRVLVSGAGLLVATALVFTGSRAAWLAGAAGLTAYAFGAGWLGLAGARWSRRYQHVLGAALAVAVALGAALTVYATARNVRHADQQSYADTVLYTLNLNTPMEVRLKGRDQFWRAAAGMMADAPVFGIGLGRYYKEVYGYAPDQESLVRPQENAHNYFLQIGAELGTVGLVAFVILLAGGVGAGIAAARTGATPLARRLGLGAAAGIAAFGVASLPGHSLLLRDGQFTFWPLVGLAMLLGGAAGRRCLVRPLGVASLVVMAAILFTAASIPARIAGEIETSLDRAPVGLYPEETGPDGEPVRWTAERVLMRVPEHATSLSVTLRSLAPFPQHVEIRFDDRVAAEFDLDTNAWRRLTLDLRLRGESAGPSRMAWTVSPGWPVADGRRLGVLVSEIAWQTAAP